MVNKREPNDEITNEVSLNMELYSGQTESVHFKHDETLTEIDKVKNIKDKITEKFTEILDNTVTDKQLVNLKSEAKRFLNFLENFNTTMTNFPSLPKPIKGTIKQKELLPF